MLYHTLTRRLVNITLVATLLLAPSLRVLPARASPTLVIGEVAWAGSSVSLADEWLELWNLSDAPISLNSLSLVGASEKPIFFPADAIIAPQSAYLIANYSATDVKSALNAAPQMVTSSLALSNSTLLIKLLDDQGNEIDGAGDGGAPPAGSSNGPKASMIRQNGSWISATSSQGFDEGQLENGTPGFCDDCSSLSPPSYDSPLPLPSDDPPQTAGSTSTEALLVPLETDLDGIAAASSTIPASDNQDIAITIIDTEISSSTPSTTEISAPSGTTSTEALDQTETTSTTEEQVLNSSSTITIAGAETPPSLASSTEINAPGETASAHESTSTRYDLVRINEIMPQPDSELEWIEITSLDALARIPLFGLSVHDTAGKILNIEEGELNATTSFILVPLSTSRLNNDGDSIYLRDPSGVLIDSLAYNESKRSESWARIPDGTGIWQLTTIPTPNQPNAATPSLALPETVTTAQPTSNGQGAGSGTMIAAIDTSGASGTTVVASSSPAVVQPKKTPSALIKNQLAIKPSTIIKPPAQRIEKITAAVPGQGGPKATAKLKVKQTTSKAKQPAKIASKKSTPELLQDITMPTLDTYRGLQVRLRGTVGSPPGLLTSHAFVILAPDGRGLLIRVPTRIKLPPEGARVEAGGTLEFSDLDVPSLKISTLQDLRPLASTALDPIPQSRTVDLLAPDTEDIWSLVSATGTVRSVKGTHIVIATDEAELNITIRPVVKYRLGRIKTGDILAVTGLLDTSKETPGLLPRIAEDIQIVGHAPPEKTVSTAEALPSWTPFGAAGMAVAATEGTKYLRDRRKRQKLEQKLQTAIPAL